MQFSKITLSLLLAVPTAFASISLSDTESLNKNEVTLGCLNTYNREVTECSKAEITSGACSSGCTTALNTLGKDVMLACRQAYAGPDTLLRKIIDGGLVVTLCKKTDAGSKDTSSTSVPAKDNVATTSIATATSTTETVTTGTGKPTGAANTDSSKSTEATATETTSHTASATATTTHGSDDTILGGGNAAGRSGVGMGVILGAVVAGVVSML